MPPSIAQEFLNAGQNVTSATNLANAINQAFSHFLGWPYRVSTGSVVDVEGKRSQFFGTLIYAQSTSNPATEPVVIQADTLACAIDVSDSLDLAALRQAYERVSDVKGLKKSPPPRISGSAHTTVTLGVIVARDASIPIEALADEVDRLNRQTPDGRWPDMVVILSKATMIQTRKLLAALGGTWSITEEYDPSDSMPKGGTGRGQEIWRAGPGERSIIEEYHSTTSTGFGLGWWEDDSAGFRINWSSDDDQHGCKRLSDVATWQGQNWVVKHTDRQNGHDVELREVFSDITADSFTQTLYQGPPANPKRFLTIRAVRSK